MSNSKKEQKKVNDNLGKVEGALNSTEQFLAKHAKVIFISIAAIAVVTLGYMAYSQYYVAPREAKASNEMFFAEGYFGKDSIQLALNGDGTNPGFLDIVKDYSMTSSGNLACYYTALCYMKLEQYDDAIKYLDKFKSDDEVFGAMAEGVRGDAYMAMSKPDIAVKSYLIAAKTMPNDFTSPLYLQKAAWVYEIQGDWKQALSTYEKIKAEYPKSEQARDIEMNIAHAKAEMEVK